MLTRYAIFDGAVKPEQDAEMRSYVRSTLLPLWRQFASAEDVQILFGVEQDPSGPNIPLILAITYADETAMERALASPARYASRDLLPEFYERFFETVQLYHYVMEAERHTPLSDKF